MLPDSYAFRTSGDSMQRVHLGWCHALVLPVILGSLSSVCLAQETRGSITGKVTDPSSAVLCRRHRGGHEYGDECSDPAVSQFNGLLSKSISWSPDPTRCPPKRRGFKKLVRSGHHAEHRRPSGRRHATAGRRHRFVDRGDRGCAAARDHQRSRWTRSRYTRHCESPRHHYESVGAAGHLAGRRIYRRRPASIA